MKAMDEVMKCLDHLEARGGHIISQAKELIDSNRQLTEEIKRDNEALSEQKPSDAWMTGAQIYRYEEA